jgi:hypothetical protein
MDTKGTSMLKRGRPTTSRFGDRLKTSLQVLATPYRFRRGRPKIQVVGDVSLPPQTFMLLDMDSGNAVSYFETMAEGEIALRRIVDNRPKEEWIDLVLVGYDKHGRSVSRTLATSLLARA